MQVIKLFLPLLFLTLKSNASSIAVPVISESDKKSAAQVVIEAKQNQKIYQFEEEILTQSPTAKDFSNANELLESVKQVKQSGEHKKHQQELKDVRQQFPIIAVQKPNSENVIDQILSKYSFKPTEVKKNSNNYYPLMIFVSASIPRESLKDLMVQAKQSGGVLVFRGMIGSLQETVDFLTKISAENISAIIDPRLFDLFKIDVVPTFVVVSSVHQDCSDNQCFVTPAHDRLVGNVTLQYALEQMVGGGDVQNIAAYHLNKLRVASKGVNRGGGDE